MWHFFSSSSVWTLIIIMNIVDGVISTSLIVYILFDKLGKIMVTL
jgi:hypothetical protein